MKKLLLFLMTLCICFSMSSVCYAGEFEKMETAPLAKLSQADTSDVSSDPVTEADSQAMAEPGAESDTQTMAEPGTEADTQAITEPETAADTSSDETSVSPEKKKANRSFTILFSGLVVFIALCIAALIYEKKK